MEIQRVDVVSTELMEALEHLIPQLSTARVPTRAEVEELVASQASSLLIARDPHIVGVLTLVVFRTTTGVHAWIEDVVVDHAARGRGIGEALSRAGISLAQELGANEVNLTSRPSREAANRLYRRIGFQQRSTNVYRYSLNEPTTKA
jgi:ribosomal protein S18 acetylase RimI-like enzyme